MVTNEAEKQFGDTLHSVVLHLIKNAVRIPPPVLAAARAVEKHEWSKLPEDDKSDRIREIAELTEAPSDIHRHFESFPHPASREIYAKYAKALALVKEQSGI